MHLREDLVDARSTKSDASGPALSKATASGSKNTGSPTLTSGSPSAIACSTVVRGAERSPRSRSGPPSTSAAHSRSVSSVVTFDAGRRRRRRRLRSPKSSGAVQPVEVGRRRADADRLAGEPLEGRDARGRARGHLGRGEVVRVGEVEHLLALRRDRHRADAEVPAPPHAPAVMTRPSSGSRTRSRRQAAWRSRCPRRCRSPRTCRRASANDCGAYWGSVEMTILPAFRTLSRRPPSIGAALADSLGAMDSGARAPPRSGPRSRPRWAPLSRRRRCCRRRRERRWRRAGTFVLAGTCTPPCVAPPGTCGAGPRALCPVFGRSARCGPVAGRATPAVHLPARSRRKPSSSSTGTPRSVAFCELRAGARSGHEVVGLLRHGARRLAARRPHGVLGLLAAERLERPGHDDGLARERPVLVRLARVAHHGTLRDHARLDQLAQRVDASPRR